MTVAARVQAYLHHHAVLYSVTTHAYTDDSRHTAEAAHVIGEELAKAVVLKDEAGYLAAIIPATLRLKLGPVHRLTGRHHLALAGEDDLARMFQDCAVGAVPALVAAYGMDLIWDDALGLAEKIYFEAGDHTSLVRIGGDDFRALMGDAPHGEIGTHF